LGQLHTPLAAGTANAAQVVQLVAEEQILQPDGQATQVLLAFA
jgi:hypothetical protein